MTDDLKVGDILTEDEIDRAWHLYMGHDDLEAFRARCIAEIVLPAVGRLEGVADRAAYADQVFGALDFGLRKALGEAAGRIRAEEAAGVSAG